MRRGATPVLGVRYGKVGGFTHQGGDQHSFVAWKHCLTERNMGARIVHNTDVVRRFFTIRSIRKRLLNVAILVAIQSAILFRVSALFHRFLLEGD